MISSLIRAWPLASVIALSMILALQIPRAALFVRVVRQSPAEPYASFVTYDADAYEKVLRKARMAWQLRRKSGRASESHVDAFDFKDEIPPLAGVTLPKDFMRNVALQFTDVQSPALKPQSVADSSPLVALRDDRQEVSDAKRVCEDLLDLPETLKTNE